jgi:hypothetical protein
MVRRVLPCVLIAAMILLGAASVAPSPSSAQGTSASPAAMQTSGHPAHIHAGTCDTLGGIDFPLNSLQPMGMMGTPTAGVASSPMAGMTSSPEAGMLATPMAGIDWSKVVAQSTTMVNASLDDILSKQRAINVHESAEKIQNYIACGDLPSAAQGGKLQIELKELNNSGFEGAAMLMDNGNGTTTVDAVLWTPGTMGTPEATPGS